MTEPPAAGNGFELPMCTRSNLDDRGRGVAAEAEDGAPPSGWVALDDAADIAAGALPAMTASGRRLVLARVDGSLLAYRDACASCGEPLHGGELDGPMLRCGTCAVEFDLPRPVAPPAASRCSSRRCRCSSPAGSGWPCE